LAAVGLGGTGAAEDVVCDARSVMEALPSGTACYVAGGDTPSRGVVIVPDIGGLRPLFTDLCDRLAAENDWAVACFEPWPGRTDLPIETRLEVAGTLDDSALLGDAVAAADLLAVSPVAILGFCMGGSFALKGAATGRFDRAVSFYGMVRLPEHWSTVTLGEPLEVLAASDDPAPILMVCGTADPWVPVDDLDTLAARGAEVVRYEGADHGFVHDPSRPAHRPVDAADAWARVGVFLG